MSHLRLCVFALLIVTGISARAEKSSSVGTNDASHKKQIETVLADVAAATSDLDHKKLAVLFLPADETPMGQARRKLLADYERGWPRAKKMGEERNIKPVSVSFTNTSVSIKRQTATISTTMKGHRRGRQTASNPYRFTLSLTSTGWKIAAMTRITPTKTPNKTSGGDVQ